MSTIKTSAIELLTSETAAIETDLGNESRISRAYVNYMASLGTPKSRQTMHERLEAALRLLYGHDCDVTTYAWHRLNHEGVAMIRMRAIDLWGTSGGTINLTLQAVRGVCCAAFNISLMSADTWLRIREVKRVKNQREPKGRALTIDEQVRLDREVKRASQCEESSRTNRQIAIRDRAILAVLLNAGPRVSEVVGLDLYDYDAAKLTLRIRRGKGMKGRTVPLAGETACGDSTADVMAAWLSVRGDEPGPLFTTLLGARKRIADYSVTNTLRYAAKRAGVDRFAAHDTRRTYISDVIDSPGHDIASASKLAGHATLATTMLYDRRGERAKVAAVDRLAEHRRAERQKLDAEQAEHAKRDEHDDDAAE